MNAQQQSDKWMQILAKAWTDDTFKKRLLVDPAGVLRENGLAVPAGVELRIHEDTDKVQHLVIPKSARSVELSDEQLASVAGGATDAAIKVVVKGTFVF